MVFVLRMYFGGRRYCPRIGGARSAQYLSSVMMSTLPIAILQSSSTQNDLVVAFFSVASVYFLLRVRVGQSYCLLYGAVLAAALAFHAKGIAAVFLSGFVVVYGGRPRAEGQVAPLLDSRRGGNSHRAADRGTAVAS